MHDLKAVDVLGCLFAKEVSVLESKSAAGSPPYSPQRRCRTRVQPLACESGLLDSAECPPSG